MRAKVSCSNWFGTILAKTFLAIIPVLILPLVSETITNQTTFFLGVGETCTNNR